MGSTQSILRQSYLIPAPTATPSTVKNQTGRVHVVTGGYSGVGLELVKLLVQTNATVVIAGRRKDMFDKAAAELVKEFPTLISPTSSAAGASTSSRPSNVSYHPKLISTGESGPVLHFVQIDLADLDSVNEAANDILARFNRLDVLTNNAGVMNTVPSDTTKTGIERQLGTNVLGPFVFTHRLVDLLHKTAQRDDVEEGDVRVTWAGSLAVDIASWMPARLKPWDVESSKPEPVETPKDGAVSAGSNSGVITLSHMTASGTNYYRSKVGNLYLAACFATRFEAKAKDGQPTAGSTSRAQRKVLSIGWNPGNLNTDLKRSTPGVIVWIAEWILMHPVHLGGYTELFAACDQLPATTALAKSQKSGSTNFYGRTGAVYVHPWGRIAPALPAGIEAGIRDGKHENLYKWCLQNSGLTDNHF